MPKINEHRDYLTEEDLTKLLSKMRSNEDRMLAELLYYTGCRISELVSITDTDIDFDRHTIKVPALKSQYPTYAKKGHRKEASWKFVVFPDRLSNRLRDYCKGKNRLFHLSRQLAYAHIHVAGLISGLGNVYCHLLRDSYATIWALRGGDLVKLQRQLGHKSLKTTTDRYIKYSTNDIREEIGKIF